MCALCVDALSTACQGSISLSLYILMIFFLPSVLHTLYGILLDSSLNLKLSLSFALDTHLHKHVHIHVYIAHDTYMSCVMHMPGIGRLFLLLLEIVFSFFVGLWTLDTSLMLLLMSTVVNHEVHLTTTVTDMHIFIFPFRC